tara:strand:+ start:9231 stop:9905 length:675 start_codon:yes stop_codon:yes gene_type:complete
MIQKKILLLVLILFSGQAYGFETSSLASGDIVFIQSTSRQAKALEEGTGSIWTHVGILFQSQGKWVVYEATQPVKSTPLTDFISASRSRMGVFSIKRLVDSELQLDKKNIGKLQVECKKHFGKKYDRFFLWDDEKMYCSEFVYKCFERGLKVQLAKFETLGDMNWKSPAVQKIIDQRWLKDIKLESERKEKLSQVLKEKVITPIQLYKSPKLQCVQSHKGAVCP